jgi:hypothetical protein
MSMIVRRSIAAVFLLTLIFTISPDAQVGSGSLATEGPATQNELIEQRVLPHLEHLFEKLVAEMRDTTIDGQKAFTGGDRFLPGKIALGLSLVLVNTPRSDPRFASYLEGYRQIADMTVEDVNETWGVYYYISALNKLRRAGLLNEAISLDTLKKLQRKLDWRPFVRVPEYTAINLPTNYLGVAFSIARLRMLLGWEDASGSQQLLATILDHYQRYSGEYGFSDETDGAGRFDRYSMLLIGEIGERLIETDMDVTPQVKAWLRKSADVVLVNLNARGDGFSYGRSIGPYGDTAFLEVLSAAAYFDVLTPVEKDMAYAFATRAVRKYVDFWVDPGMQSVNMWEKGRATDQYRNKTRILGENFSLSDHLVKTNDVWNRIGYKNRAPSPAFEGWLAKLPRTTLTWFARGEHDRALLTYRDGPHVFSLPIVNGGPQYHQMNAYFPIPYSHRLVQGSPNTDYPQLLPKLSLADGLELMPLVYMKDIVLQGNVLSYRQEAFDRLGGNTPVRDDRLSSEVRYEFEIGRITRVETYRAAVPLGVDRMSFEFGSFSEQPRIDGTRIRFGAGDVTELTVEGLRACDAQPVTADSIYKAPHGAMKTVVRCQSEKMTLDKPLTITWTLRYR